MGGLLATPLSIAGVSLIIIGVILAIIGLILMFTESSTTKSWYVWVLLIGGILLGVAGAIMLAAAIMDHHENNCACATPCQVARVNPCQ